MNKPKNMMTVLVVDDDPDALSSTCSILETTHKVLAASCVSDAIRTAIHDKPDIIILDVLLQGGQNGFTIFRELGENAKTAKIPVIFLSGVNECANLSFGAEEVMRYLGRKPFAFLEKPSSPKALLQAVTNALSRN